MTEAFLIGGARTPVGRYGGALSTVRPDDMAALVIKAAVDRAGVDRMPWTRSSSTDACPLARNKIKTSYTENLTDPDVPVQVRFTAAGSPLAIRHDGQIWAVAAEPVHWFERCDWWNTRNRAPLGTGDLVSVEHWRVQLRRPSSASALQTFELRRDPLSDQWLLIGITDTEAAAA